MTIQPNQGFASENIWEVINHISFSSILKKVASAYLGSSVAFKWNSGDVLLIGLSEKNVSDQLVDLDKLEEIISAGVKVYRKENLHSKIYFNNEMAVVCSCNLSEASQIRWLEAGIYTSDPQILQSVEAFFDKYAQDDNLVTKEALEKLRLSKPTVDSLREIDLPIIKERVWVITTVPSDKEDPATENALSKKNFEAKGKVDENRVSLFNIKLNDPEFFGIKPGDFIIRFTKNDSERLIFPLYKCIQASFINDKLYYINLTQQKGLNSKKWEEVKASFEAFDLVNQNGELTHNKGSLIQKLLLLFSF